MYIKDWGLAPFGTAYTDEANFLHSQSSDTRQAAIIHNTFSFK
jgi:hypothetical protein